MLIKKIPHGKKSITKMTNIPKKSPLILPITPVNIDQIRHMRVQFWQFSSAPGAETAGVARLRRGFLRGRKPKNA
jgi:hypothetical protein